MNIKHIELNTGKACNNRCIFCMSKNVPQVMLKLASFEVVKKKLQSYREEGYNSVGFLGGDVSIHPRVIDIIKYAKEVGYEHINIITNGMLFSRFEFARDIVLAGANRINISIHSHREETEDYLIQVPGGLKKKLQAIDNFNQLFADGILQAPLSINIVVTKLNYEHLVNTVIYFAEQKNIRDIRMNFVWLSDGVKENWDEITLSYREFLPVLKKVIYIASRYKVRVTFDTIPPCILSKVDPKHFPLLVKHFLGEQFDIIDQIEHINVNDYREKFKWKDKKKDVLKKKFPQCQQCLYNSSCEGVWKQYAMIYGDSEFVPCISEP